MLVQAARAAITAGNPDIARQIASDMTRRMLRPVINGTGTVNVVLTGQGALRSPAR